MCAVVSPPAQPPSRLRTTCRATAQPWEVTLVRPLDLARVTNSVCGDHGEAFKATSSFPKSRCRDAWGSAPSDDCGGAPVPASSKSRVANEMSASSTVEKNCSKSNRVPARTCTGLGAEDLPGTLRYVGVPCRTLQRKGEKPLGWEG